MAQTKGGAYVRINSNYTKLLPAEKKIADILLKNSDQIETMSINELADHAQASKATVTRFCKRLGFNGFRDFRVSAIKDTHSGIATYTEAPMHDAVSGDKKEISTEERIGRICKSNAQACNDTQLLLDPETLEKAADILLSKSRIFIVGEGPVAPVALDFYQKLLRIGLVPIYSTDRRIQRMHVSLTNKNDAVIAFDLAGSTKVSVEMVEKASQNRAETITICNTIGSALAKAGGLNLFGPGRLGSDISGTLAPRIALLCIVDCLFTVIEQKLGSKCFDSIKKTNQVILDDWI